VLEVGLRCLTNEKHSNKWCTVTMDMHVCVCSACIHTYVNTYIRTYTPHTPMYVCIYTCMYVCVCVCVCVCLVFAVNLFICA
jgi:hypothetical protein